MADHMSNKKSVAIIGCGVFGAMAAIKIAENNFNVTVFETKNECLKGASYNNQNRLHLGFHYPRDIETARQCIKGFNRFKQEFPECISSDFSNLYFIANENSATSLEQYQVFCSKLGVYFELISEDEIPIIVSNASQPILCKEEVYDCNILRNLIKNRLNKSGAILKNNIKVENIKYQNNSYILDCSNNKEYSFDHVINCSYADINRLTEQLGFKTDIAQYEYTFIPIVKMDIPRVGITIMDGPFMTLLPFGKSNDFLLYHVDHSVIEREVARNLNQSWLSKNTSPMENIDVNSIFNQMKNDCVKFVPDIANAEMLNYLEGPRMVMAKSDKTDARPSILNSYNESYHTVFSGKIDHCVWVADELLSKI